MLQERIFIIIIACVLDLIFGDPHWLWHPVQGMGWLIDHVEAWMRKRFRIREERDADIRKKQVAGTFTGPKRSAIHIWTEDNPMYTRIYVKDEGCGIAESELKNIFKRFYRINKEVNPNSVGIGLSLTKSIVEGMGGKISVRSELGCYTQFILTFVHT